MIDEDSGILSARVETETGPGSPAAAPPGSDDSRARAPHLPAASARATVEFFVTLLLCVLLFRSFAAEAYIVPTGSMAPTLMGIHREVTCPECALRFAVGMDEQGRSGRPICPNCGANEFEDAAPADRNGDRLLVQKYLFDWRTPRRWEVAVFQNPGDPSQAYVKRVVGLPGESILIDRGDLYVNGRVARKTLAEQRAMRLLVYDNDYLPRDIARYPRWSFRNGQGAPGVGSGWRANETRFVHDPDEPGRGEVDWLEYRHWDPDRGDYGPVRDFTPYNGGELRGENRVDDLMIEARVTVGADCGGLALRLRSGADTFFVALPNDAEAPPSAWRNGQPLLLNGARPGPWAASKGRPVLVEASIMDHRLTVALDGALAFEPVDDDDPTPGPGPGPLTSPIALGVLDGGAMEVSGLRIFRDVYYTGSLVGAPRRPFGVEVPYPLGPGEYFVLGDNSPVSNDSRFWPGSPVVGAGLLVGKPFLVHLPSRGIPVKVFGHELYWVPDPREIRYIR